MTIYRIPDDLRTLIFDIDSTLYTNSFYAFEQVDVQIRHFAHLRGIQENEARKMMTEYRKKWSRQHGGKKISLGNAFTAFGIPLETSIKWRKELIEPAKFLSRDEKLREVLVRLKKSYKLICVTNNPVLPAKKTLKALGVSDVLQTIIGLDTCRKSKPAEEPIRLAARIMNSQIGQCLSIGDRYDIDIALPLELGMGGILVDGVAEVYQLPAILSL
ncbi:MAG: HAD family hydrolase [Treponema sp.]|jgi:phosphoglycolate phosphatase/putative hydrolase of the HAD superfamily|nr:HAD family hydrolase [Treponema sp.]